LNPEKFSYKQPETSFLTNAGKIFTQLNISKNFHYILK